MKNKFDNMLLQAVRIRSDDKDLLQSTLGHLLEIQKALNEAIEHYDMRIAAGDALDLWYVNASEHYERRLNRLNKVIVLLENKFKEESNVSVQAVQGTPDVQGIQDRAAKRRQKRGLHKV